MISSEVDHVSDVFGVAWSPLVRDEYAVGCMDGTVHLCNMNKGDKKILKDGHSKRVFHVVFNPSMPTLLASGSDD